MEALKLWLLHPWMGAPTWVWCLVLFIGGVNEIVQRAQWTRAQSVLQGLAVFVISIPILGALLQAIPLIGWLLRKIAGSAPVVAGPEVLRAYLPVALLVALAGCATPSEAYTGARKFQGGAADTLTVSYDGWREWDLEYQTIVAKTAPTKQEMLEQLASYRKKVQATVDKAFGVAKVAVQSLRRSLDAADAMKAGSFAAGIASIVAAFFEIGRLFLEFKIGVPPPKVAS